MADIQIVTLTPQEWPLYRQIRLEALLKEPQAFSSRYAENLARPDSYWQNRLIETQAGGKSWLLFAKENERIIGLIGAYRVEDSAVVEIISVYVTKAERGRGAASALMTAILEQVRQGRAFRKAILSVNAAQTAAVALYQRFGFHIVGEESGLQGDGNVHTEYHMEMEFDNPPSASARA